MRKASALQGLNRFRDAITELNKGLNIDPHNKLIKQQLLTSDNIKPDFNIMQLEINPDMRLHDICKRLNDENRSLLDQ